MLSKEKKYDKKEYNKEWNKKNKKKINARRKELYQKNKEKINSKRREYNKKNKEQKRISDKKYYLKNKIKLNKKHREYHQKRQVNFISTYKKGKCCSLCSYDEHCEILQFHHKNKTKKLFEITISKISKKTIEELKTEIDKCILICPNCHFILHLKERGSKNG